ncbi:MAG: transporter, family, oxalate/formate antiporter [Propionibacteriaceae bacterium]|jgi:OFA family oxalate/formate antiporter-like MFS transporter|nr:transporter [Propionibacteriaceae bacterium]MDX6322983.1 transporter, family, oxalate/formate antiporter [Propionibacteriaceae bacterium]
MTTDTPTTVQANPTRGRWGLVAAALLLQFSIGAVYAWSVFSKALQAAEPFKLNKVEATLPFEVTIGMIFIGTYIGGRIQDRRGPRMVAMIGGAIYAFGVILASFAKDASQLWLVVLGYGVIGGFGLGLAYIVPIAMLQKWFPDRRGLITGLAVGGFGFGAVLTAPVAQRLIDANKDVPTAAFLPLGIGYLICSVAGAAFFRNPPEGYKVPGYVPPTTGRVVDSGRDYTPGEAMRTWQWYALTAILTLAVTAGIALISQAAASATDIAGYTAAAAAGAVGILAIFNGAGRVVLAALSEKIGRMTTFIIILAVEGVCLLLLPHVSNQAAFFVLAAMVYLCYGGAFGTMPATAGDFFGVKHAGAIYGLMLIGWSIGGVVGPLIASWLIGSGKNYTAAYTTIGIIALAAIALPLVTRMPRMRKDATEGELGSTGAARSPRASR